MAAFQRLTHGVHIADAFKAVISTAIGEIHDRLDDIVHLLRVDEIGHAKLAGHVHLGLVDVDADDLVSANHARALNHIKADAAEPENHHIAARLHLGVEDHGADACGHPAADIANLVKGRVLADFSQGDLWQHGVIGKGGTAHIM